MESNDSSASLEASERSFTKPRSKRQESEEDSSPSSDDTTVLLQGESVKRKALPVQAAQNEPLEDTSDEEQAKKKKNKSSKRVRLDSLAARLKKKHAMEAQPSMLLTGTPCPRLLLGLGELPTARMLGFLELEDLSELDDCNLLCACVDRAWTQRDKEIPSWQRPQGTTAKDRMLKWLAARQCAQECENDNFDMASCMEPRIEALRPPLPSDNDDEQEEDEEEASYHSISEYVEEAMDCFDEVSLEDRRNSDFFVRIILDGKLLFEGFLPTRRVEQFNSGVLYGEKGALHLDLRKSGESLATAIRSAWNPPRFADPDDTYDLDSFVQQRLRLTVLECRGRHGRRVVLVTRGSSRRASRPGGMRPTFAMLDATVFENDNHFFFIRPFFCFEDGGKALTSLSMLFVHHSD